MGVQSTTGILASISASLPATEDQAGYEALTYTEIEQLLTVPAFGAETQIITYDPLKDGITRKDKGFINYGTQALVAVLDTGSAGQDIVISASEGANKRLAHTIKLQYPAGEVRYYQVFVMSSQEDPGSSNEMINFNMSVEINSPILRIAAP